MPPARRHVDADQAAAPALPLCRRGQKISAGLSQGGVDGPKLFASEMAERVTSDCDPVHGGLRFGTTIRFEKCSGDMRVFQIYDGPSEIQRVDRVVS